VEDHVVDVYGVKVDVTFIENNLVPCVA